MPEGSLTGRVCIISGAATGIGRAGAILFAAEGGSVVVFDSSPIGEETVKTITRAGGSARFIQGDVSNRSNVKNAVKETVERLGRLDIVWSNAGIPLFKTLLDTEEDEWDRIIGVNLKGGYLLSRYAIPELIKCGGGSVLFTGSTASYFGSRRWAAYCAPSCEIGRLLGASVVGRCRLSTRELRPGCAGDVGACVGVATDAPRPRAIRSAEPRCARSGSGRHRRPR